MKITKDVLSEITPKMQAIYARLCEKVPEIKTKELTDGAMHDLWFRTWASVA